MVGLVHQGCTTDRNSEHMHKSIGIPRRNGRYPQNHPLPNNFNENEDENTKQRDIHSIQYQGCTHEIGELPQQLCMYDTYILCTVCTSCVCASKPTCNTEQVVNVLKC